MGADIRAFIEYGPSPLDRELKNDTRRAGCFGEVFVPRDYDLFSAFSGTRRGQNGIKPVTRRRGLPDPHFLSDRVSLENSEFDDEKKRFVPSADHWDHSWLTLAELKLAIKRSNHETPAMDAIVAAMTALPHAILVFWYT